MTSKFDKRKANRIQGGWAKGTDKGKTGQREFKNEPMYAETKIDLKFDEKVPIDSSPKFNVFEIKDNVSMNLNDIHNIGSSPAEIKLFNDFIDPEEALSLSKYFHDILPWQQRENATPKGDKYLEPRKTCWYGLPYSYSKVNMKPNNNWDPKLADLLKRVQDYLPDKRFNSVMCNLYCGAKNSIDWHADDEKSLGKFPTIASISLGSTRTFEMCLRSELFSDYDKKQKNPYRSRVKDEPPFDGCSILYQIILNSGSLLIMSGSLQDYWLHRVPKEYHDKEPRINFTFRDIHQDS